MTPQRQEKLLEEVTSLVSQLEDCPIYAAGAEGGASRSAGVPSSVMGNVVSFLVREQDLKRFHAFVAAMPKLDTLQAQNQNNPQGHHAALQKVLEPWLEEVELSVEELTYVLAWTRRLLPSKSKPVKVDPRAARGKPRRKSVKEEMSTSRLPEAGKGNQLGAALLEALKGKK